MVIKIEITGIAATSKAIDAAIARRADAIRALVYVVGTEIATAAMRLSPVDTGYLRSSRYVEHTTYTAAMTASRIGFSATYARHVHERKRKYRVGQAKFLSKAAADFNRARLPSLFAALVAAGATEQRMPTVHPTGPLVGPEVHPRRRRSRAKRLRRQAKIDKLQGVAR